MLILSGEKKKTNTYVYFFLLKKIINRCTDFAEALHIVICSTPNKLPKLLVFVLFLLLNIITLLKMFMICFHFR